MKSPALAAAIFSVFVLGGCNPGGEAGDPNANATPGPPASLGGNQARPGTPGGPTPGSAPQSDPLGGRTGAAAGQ